MPLDYTAFRQRRERLIHAMGSGVAILAAGSELARNRDTHFPFRSDSYFHYLTGFPEPEAVLVLVAGDEPRHLLFCRDKDPDKEIWDGFRYGPAAAAEVYGFDGAFPLAELDDRMPEFLAGQADLHYLVGRNGAWDARIMGWLNAVRAKVRSGVRAPARLVDLADSLDEMRLIKGPEELDLMRRAGEISAAAHVRALRNARPGRYEYEMEAELYYAFRLAGATAPAYPSIVAGGANACILHYVNNDQVLRDGDLLLIDAGAEYQGYAGDITRTFPVGGKFSGPQKAVYEVVLAAQAAALEQVRPGRTWNQPHDAAVRVLTRGMVDLGLLKGDVDGLIEQDSYKRFYMHRTGHWLGLDVHDAGDYKVDEQWRPLQPGMVLTVEPGMYIRPSEDVPGAYWNIGIRIEDDVNVTPDGCEVLTGAAPKSVAAIEEVMNHG